MTHITRHPLLRAAIDASPPNGWPCSLSAEHGTQPPKLNRQSARLVSGRREFDTLRRPSNIAQKRRL